MSTVRVIPQNLAITEVDITHPDGTLDRPVPVAPGQPDTHMSGGAKDSTDVVTFTVRNNNLSIDTIEGDQLVAQGTPKSPVTEGAEKVDAPVEYDVVTMTPDEGAIPSLYPHVHAQGLAVNGGVLVIYGLSARVDPFDNPFGTPVPNYYERPPVRLGFFTAGEIAIPDTKLLLGGSNQRSSFAGQ